MINWEGCGKKRLWSILMSSKTSLKRIKNSKKKLSGQTIFCPIFEPGTPVSEAGVPGVYQSTKWCSAILSYGTQIAPHVLRARPSVLLRWFEV
jgi:hypothetical protein